MHSRRVLPAAPIFLPVHRDRDGRRSEPGLSQGTLLSQCLLRTKGHHSSSPRHGLEGVAVYQLEGQTLNSRVSASFCLHKLHVHVHAASRGVQVWPLTQFFLFPFCKNSLICLEGKSMTPHRGNTIFFRSSQQLPRLRLGPSKGFLSCHCALLGPSTRLVRCFRNNRDTRTQSGVPR